MKELTCDHCDESVYLAEEGETLEGKETPLEHMERTNHAPKSPELRKCKDCENVWSYTGDADRPTCPHCEGKRTVGVGD